MVKLWVDDMRQPPNDTWYRAFSTESALSFLLKFGEDFDDSILISLDHDAGEWAVYGGDYINILNKLEELNPPCLPHCIFHFHSMNPVGVENMRRIVFHNDWRYTPVF